MASAFQGLDIRTLGTLNTYVDEGKIGHPSLKHHLVCKQRGKLFFPLGLFEDA